MKKIQDKNKAVKRAIKKGEHEHTRAVKRASLKKTASSKKKPISTKQFRTLLKQALAGRKPAKKPSLLQKVGSWFK